MMNIKDIGERIRTQDNRMTHNPIFIVQQKVRDYGFDTEYGDATDVVWINMPNDCAEATPEEAAEFEAAYNETGETPCDWIRTAFKDRWEFVTACFTEEGCKDYLRQNGHNISGETRIYVASGYRNDEWEAVRNHLMEQK